MKRRIFFSLTAKIKGIFLFTAFFTFPFLLNLVFHFFRIQFLLKNPVVFMLINYALCFLLIILLNVFFKKKVFSFLTNNDNWFYSMESSIMPALKAFGIGFGASFILILFFEGIPVPDFLKEWLRAPNEGFIILIDSLKEKKHIEVLLLFFFIVVAAPVFEEVIFRGFLQESMQRLFKKEIFVLPAVSLVFSFAHFNSLSNMIFAFIVGFFLSKKRKDTGSISSSIWMHSIINLTGLLTGIIYLYLLNKL